MSARDDYPAICAVAGNKLHHDAGLYRKDGEQMIAALDEIDRLRALLHKVQCSPFTWSPAATYVTIERATWDAIDAIDARNEQVQVQPNTTTEPTHYFVGYDANPGICRVCGAVRPMPCFP